MSITRTLPDILAEDVDEVVSDFESESCTVSKTQQANQKWTIVATCPDQEP
jgi:hypothetical protein